MKREERTKLTKERIIKYAIIEFGTNGYDHAVLNRICDNGIPKGLLYHNYPSRDDVYLACVEQSFADLLHALESKSIGNDIHQYTNTRMSFFRKNPHEASIIFDSLLGRPECLIEQVKKIRAPFNQYNLIFFKQVLANIPLRNNLTEEDALAYLSVLQTAFNVRFLSETQGTLTPKEIKKHENMLLKLIDTILYGIVEEDISCKHVF